MKTAEEFAGMVEECWVQGAPGILADWVSEFGMAEKLWEEWKRLELVVDRLVYEAEFQEDLRYEHDAQLLAFVSLVLRKVFLPCRECGGDCGVWCTRCPSWCYLRVELPREECRECRGTGMELDGDECLVCHGHGTVVK